MHTQTTHTHTKKSHTHRHTRNTHHSAVKFCINFFSIASIKNKEI